jgi:hypothetical protein
LRFPSHARRERAATIVSFALIAPIFLFIIFGALEFGRVLMTWMVITSEVAEAARYGAVHYDDTRDNAVQSDEIKRYIQRRLDGLVDSQGLVPAPLVCITSDPNIDVTISYRVPLVIPLVAQLLPNPFPLSARSMMRAETAK